MTFRFCLIVAVTVVLSYASDAKQRSIKFTLDAEIEGIEKGDTLKFSRITLPNWHSEHDFDVIVKRDGAFRYSGTIPHSQLYQMQYSPVRGEIATADRRGKDMLIGYGVTKITGTRDYIYYTALESNIYDRHLRPVLQLEDSLNSSRGDILRRIEQAKENKDSAEMKRQSDMFNNFHSVNKDNFDRLRGMRAVYDSLIGGEYAAVQMLQSLSSPLEKIKASYRELSEEGKESYYGSMVGQVISDMEQLSEGRIAPDIELTTTDNRKIKISDFKGQYLLIYRFGMCPGSLYIDNQVSALYNANSDKLEVIGVTDSFDILRSFDAQMQDGADFMGMNIKDVMRGMLSHPWKNEVEIPQYDNSVFENRYYALGLPFFIFISPDGKIISRAVGMNAFQAAKDTLK